MELKADKYGRLWANVYNDEMEGLVYDIFENDIFINRWSPSAMSGEPITDDELFSLFEAARWAPSSHNNQPWRFVYAKRDTQYWDKIFNFLVEGNRIWVKNAAAIVVVISKTVSEYNGSFIRTHSFDITPLGI